MNPWVTATLSRAIGKVQPTGRTERQREPCWRVPDLVPQYQRFEMVVPVPSTTCPVGDLRSARFDLADEVVRHALHSDSRAEDRHLDSTLGQ